MGDKLTAIEVLLARAAVATRNADLLDQSIIEYEAKIVEYRDKAALSQQLAASCLAAVESLSSANS